MITLAQAEARLRGAVCPECLHSELFARLRLPDGSECICSAVCGHCGATFDAEFTRFESIHQIEERLGSQLWGFPCQVCGQISYELSLQSEHPSRDHYFEARCRNCGIPYAVQDHRQHIGLTRSRESGS